PNKNSTRCKRCTWSEEEDQLLLSMANKSAVIDWADVAKAMSDIQPRRGPTKTAKQCRERWHNRVNPIIKQNPWTPEEESNFFELHQQHGAKWSEIAVELSGRTDNTIKNFFYCRLRKVARRINKGIISDDMKTSAKEVEHTVYLITYLRSYYVAEHDGTAHPSADKYIAEMIRSSTITASRIDSYLRDYMASVKLSSQSVHDSKVSETDDSLTKLQSNNVLPPIAQCPPQPQHEGWINHVHMY
ncbi:MAG: Myb-like DNA-binding domain-containing protein, partial [Candidatus Pacebacteria bacterium]|nr:Myb-like DNA-binding domain-containing protein [Candidatus Paceibacterota bacterium]